MNACLSCGCYCRPTELSCPHCGHGFMEGVSERAAAALLLGLSLSLGVNGCAQAEYGVIDTPFADEDDDGWSVEDGDCDDANDAINPGATETADDGVDSNCDDDDNT